jgi:ribosomal protein S18 acetylase RimI-like enzyme
MINYRRGNDLNLDEVIALYQNSTLGMRRPIGEPARMADMVKNANLVVTAWEGDKLIGISRALSDFSFVTYLSDLAVDQDYQHQGIGKELIRQTQQAAPAAKIILLAAPAAELYYPHIGFTRHPQAWMLNPGETIGNIY